LIVFLLVFLIVLGGVLVAPFSGRVPSLERFPLPVDAIPDTGENQQIVFSQWPGRSPQDLEDQVTYPLTTYLLGLPGIKTIRSYSYFGFSTIYVIFEEDLDFYWTRARIQEKLSGMPPQTLPQGVQPVLGPDATALGQVFWYTLEGQDEEGNPTGGWDLHELRTLQDWYVRYGLMSAKGVSEVASVGGFVQEYHIDVHPDALRAFGVTLGQVFNAVKMSNNEEGARNIEINNVEYFIRARGFVRSLQDLEEAVVTLREGVPVLLKQVATVGVGPAQRRGVLDKEGAEAVGGVVVVRYGENPMEVIQNIKKEIERLSSGLPQKILEDGTRSQVKIVPFYDRTGLIEETLNTLKSALTHQGWITLIVVLLMLLNLRSALLISGLLPLAVLLTFIAMKLSGVDANIVALSGIAIAIGTIVDMGVVLVENILKHLEREPHLKGRFQAVYQGTMEVASAVMTAVATTVISFLPVFTMEAAEGKLFKPLAFTKTFALLSSIVITVVLIPPLVHLLMGRQQSKRSHHSWGKAACYLLGGAAVMTWHFWTGLVLLLLALIPLTGAERVLEKYSLPGGILTQGVLMLLAAFLLAETWMPLGPGKGVWRNFSFVVLTVGLVLLFFKGFQWFYPRILAWALSHRLFFLSIPLALILMGLLSWLGVSRVMGWLPESWRESAWFARWDRQFPGLGEEFMPPLDEGSYLYMPTTSVHASIDEVREVLRLQDQSFQAIPEVVQAVGKLGRAETPLDPAPISMIETVINLAPEFLQDTQGDLPLFRFDPEVVDLFRDPLGKPVLAPDGAAYAVKGSFLRDDMGLLIPDPRGRPFRLWRPPLNPEWNPGRKAWPGIREEEDIWQEITTAGQILGTTSAPKLQPIAARMVMLQSGMRAPMGLKVFGPDLASIEQVGIALEGFLKQVPSIQPETVIADRIIGKPYLEFIIDREAIARYGLMLEEVQKTIMMAVGGIRVTETVEGRERYAVRIRYPRELRQSWESLQEVLVAGPNGVSLPLEALATLTYVTGPQVIKSEDTFLTSYVIFDKRVGTAEVAVVREAEAFLQEKLKSGALSLPSGVSYAFAGNYEHQVRSAARLRLMLPLSLLLIFLILYLQFKQVSTAIFVFSGIGVAWSGGFLLLWLFQQPWFLDVHWLGTNLRDLFQIQPFHLSVAVWVGFLALFGIATDDGVMVATTLNQKFREQKPVGIAAIRKVTVDAGRQRIRPAIITSATTVIALMPVFTATGRGSDIMIPMAIPTFGGMMVAQISVFVVPVLYSWIEEWRQRPITDSSLPPSSGEPSVPL
jgi:Cu(I)/Ag(I) efflux system membrane protein CusA/SilA